MLGLLLMLFILLPLLDLLLLIFIADAIGIVETVLIVVFTGFIGVSLIRREGFRILLRLRNITVVEEVGHAMIEGALLTAGGIFLLSPGVVTDAIGFALVFSWTRTRIAVKLRQRLQDSDRFQVSVRRF